MDTTYSDRILMDFYRILMDLYFKTINLDKSLWLWQTGNVSHYVTFFTIFQPTNENSDDHIRKCKAPPPCRCEPSAREAKCVMTQPSVAQRRRLRYACVCASSTMTSFYALRINCTRSSDDAHNTTSPSPVT